MDGRIQDSEVRIQVDPALNPAQESALRLQD
jgi:hypothetical protein